MNKNRTRGIREELDIIKKLKELGYFYLSSRSESKNADDKGIDLVVDPNHNITLPIPVSLPQIKKCINIPDLNKIFINANILFWNRQKKVTKNFVSTGKYVILEQKNFWELLKLLAK